VEDDQEIEYEEEHHQTQQNYQQNHQQNHQQHNQQHQPEVVRPDRGTGEDSDEEPVAQVSARMRWLEIDRAAMQGRHWNTQGLTPNKATNSGFNREASTSHTDFFEKIDKKGKQFHVLFDNLYELVSYQFHN